MRDALNESRDQPFRTFDHLNDPNPAHHLHCKSRNAAGWWYSTCARTNLNLQGMFWGSAEVVRSTMRIRPRAYPRGVITSPTQCQNGGRCAELKGNYVCECAPGYMGTLCKKRRRDLKPCANSGMPFGDDKCMCAPGYAGLRCEFADLCAGSYCPAGTLCSPQHGHCLCFSGDVACHNSTAIKKVVPWNKGLLFVVGSIAIFLCLIVFLYIYNHVRNPPSSTPEEEICIKENDNDNEKTDTEIP